MFSSPKRKIEKYFRKNPQVKSIVVAGSYGRKSAIRALSALLGETYLVTMGVNKNIQPDVVVLDYGSMSDFPDIQPDLTIVTSCRSDDEAKQFFEVANKSRKVLVNFSDVPQEYAKYLTNPEIITYGDELPADFYFENHDFTINGYTGDIVNPEREHVPAKLKILGEHNVRPLIMGVAVAKLFNVERQTIVKALEDVRPLNGRMQPCHGLQNSIIIDDSADTSDISVYYGLRTIYALDAPSRIVVTDDLSKLGKFDESHIDEVVVLGAPVEQHIKGAKISFFATEVELVNYLGQHFEDKGIILLEIPLPQIISSRDWESAL